MSPAPSYNDYLAQKYGSLYTGDYLTPAANGATPPPPIPQPSLDSYMPGSTYRPQYDSYGNPIPPAGGAETPRYGTGTDPVTGADTYYRLYEGADGNYYEQLMPGVNAPVPSPGLGGVTLYLPNQYGAGISANLANLQPRQTDPSVMGRVAQQASPYPDYYQHAPTEETKTSWGAQLNNFLNNRTPYTHPFEGRVKSEVDYYDPSAASQYEPSGAIPQIKDASGNPLDEVYYNDIDPTYIANILGYDVRVPGGERWTLQDAVDRGVFSVAEAQQLYRMQQYTPAEPGNLAGALGAFAVGQDVIKYDPLTGAGATEPYQGAYLSTENGFADAVGNVTNTVSGAVAKPFNAVSDKLDELGWYDSGFVNAVNEWDKNASATVQDEGGRLAGGVIATIGNVPIINATMRGVDQTANNVSGGTAENLGEFVQGNPFDVFTNGSNAVYKVMAIRAANERWGEGTYAVPDRFPDKVSEAASYPLRQGIGRAQGNVNGDDFYNWLLNDAQGRQALEQFASPTRSDASGMLLPIDSKALEEAYLADQGFLAGLVSGYAMDPTSLADVLTVGLGGAGLAARGAGMARLGTGLLRASRLADTAGIFGLDWAIEKAGGKALWMLLPDTVKRQRIAMAQDEMATGIRAIITSENSAVRTAGGGTPVGAAPSAATPGGAPGRAATGTPIPAIRNVGPNNPSIAAAQASPAGAAPLTQLTNNGFSQSPLSTTSPRTGVISQAVNVTHNDSGLMYMINATVPQNVDVIDNAINPQAMAWVPYFKDPSTGLYHRIGSRPMTLDQAGQQIGYHTNQRLLDEAEGLADEALGGADVADDAAAALPGRSLGDSGLVADEMPTYQRVGNGHVDRKIYGVKSEDGSANYALVAERQTPRQGDRNNGVMWDPDPEARIWRAHIADSSGAPQGRHIAPQRSQRNTRAEAEQMIIEAERRRTSGFSVSNEMDNRYSDEEYYRLFMQWWESLTPAERDAFNRGELDGPTLFELENLANRQGTESLDNFLGGDESLLIEGLGERYWNIVDEVGSSPTNVSNFPGNGINGSPTAVDMQNGGVAWFDPDTGEVVYFGNREEGYQQYLDRYDGSHLAQVLGERYWDIVDEVGSTPTSVSDVPGNGIGGNPVAVNMRNGGVAWFDPDTGEVVYFGNREEGYRQYRERYDGRQHSENDLDSAGPWVIWWGNLTDEERRAFMRGELDGPTQTELENLANRQGTESLDNRTDRDARRDDLLQRMEEVNQQLSDLVGAGNDLEFNRLLNLFDSLLNEFDELSRPGNIDADEINRGMDEALRRAAGLRERLESRDPSGNELFPGLGERYWDIVDEVGSTPTNVSNFPGNGIDGNPVAVDMRDGGVAWFDPGPGDETGEVMYFGDKEEGYRQYRDLYNDGIQQLNDAVAEWLQSVFGGRVYPSRTVNGKQLYSINDGNIEFEYPSRIVNGEQLYSTDNLEIEVEVFYNDDGTAKFLQYKRGEIVAISDRVDIDNKVMSLMFPGFKVAQEEARYKIAALNAVRNEVINGLPKDIINKLSSRKHGTYGYQSRLEELVVNLVKGISRPTPPPTVRPGQIGRQLSGQMEVGKKVNGITIKSDEPLSEDAIYTHAMTKWWEAIGANNSYYDQVFWYSDDYELFKLWWKEASPEERFAYATTPEPKEHYYKASKDASRGVVADWRQYLDGPGKLFGRLTPKWETPRRIVSQEKFVNAAVRSLRGNLPDDERNQFYESVMEAYNKWFSEASNDEIDLYLKDLSPGPHINTPIKIQEMFAESDKARLQYVFPREDMGGGRRVPEGFDLRQSANIDPQPGDFSVNNVVDDTPHVNTAVTPETLSRKKNISAAINYLGQRRQAIGSDTITGRVATALGSNSSQATMEHGAWRVSLFIDNIEAQARATGATVRQLIAENTDHELWHAMRQIGAISDEDHAVIVDWARKTHPMPKERIDRYREIWEREKDRASAYYASWEDFIEEEEAAYAIGMWARGKYGAPVHPARKALEQFYDFVDKLASYFRSTPSARTVRRNWDQGKYAVSGIADETKVVNAIATAEREMVERRVKLVRTGTRQAQQVAGYRKKFAKPSEANVISPSETKVFGDADHVTTYDPAREVYVVTRMSDGETTLIHKDMMNGNTPEGIQAMGAQAIKDRDAARVKAEEDRFDKLRTEVRGMVSNGRMENEEVFTQSEIKALIDRGDITPTPGSALDRFAKGEPFNKLEYDEAVENLRSEISAALKKNPVQGGSTADDAADVVRSPLQRIIGKAKNGKPNIRWFAKTEPGKLVPNGAVDGSLEADIETLKNMTTEEWASKEGQRLRRKHFMNPTGGSDAEGRGLAGLFWHKKDRDGTDVGEAWERYKDIVAHRLANPETRQQMLDQWRIDNFSEGRKEQYDEVIALAMERGVTQEDLFNAMGSTFVVGSRDSDAIILHPGSFHLIQTDVKGNPLPAPIRCQIVGENRGKSGKGWDRVWVKVLPGDAKRMPGNWTGSVLWDQLSISPLDTLPENHKMYDDLSFEDSLREAGAPDVNPTTQEEPIGNLEQDYIFFGTMELPDGEMADVVKNNADGVFYVLGKNGDPIGKGPTKTRAQNNARNSRTAGGFAPKKNPRPSLSRWAFAGRGNYDEFGVPVAANRRSSKDKRAVTYSLKSEQGVDIPGKTFEIRRMDEMFVRGKNKWDAQAVGYSASYHIQYPPNKKGFIIDVRRTSDGLEYRVLMNNQVQTGDLLRRGKRVVHRDLGTVGSLQEALDLVDANAARAERSYIESLPEVERQVQRPDVPEEEVVEDVAEEVSDDAADTVLPADPEKVRADQLAKEHSKLMFKADQIAKQLDAKYTVRTVDNTTFSVVNEDGTVVRYIQVTFDERGELQLALGDELPGVGSEAAQRGQDMIDSAKKAKGPKQTKPKKKDKAPTDQPADAVDGIKDGKPVTLAGAENMAKSSPDQLSKEVDGASGSGPTVFLLKDPKKKTKGTLLAFDAEGNLVASADISFRSKAQLQSEIVNFRDRNTDEVVMSPDLVEAGDDDVENAAARAAYADTDKWDYYEELDADEIVVGGTYQADDMDAQVFNSPVRAVGSGGLKAKMAGKISVVNLDSEGNAIGEPFLIRKAKLRSTQRIPSAPPVDTEIKKAKSAAVSASAEKAAAKKKSSAAAQATENNIRDEKDILTAKKAMVSYGKATTDAGRAKAMAVLEKKMDSLGMDQEEIRNYELKYIDKNGKPLDQGPSASNLVDEPFSVSNLAEERLDMPDPGKTSKYGGVIGKASLLSAKKTAAGEIPLWKDPRANAAAPGGPLDKFARAFADMSSEFRHKAHGRTIFQQMAELDVTGDEVIRPHELNQPGNFSFDSGAPTTKAVEDFLKTEIKTQRGGVRSVGEMVRTYENSVFEIHRLGNKLRAGKKLDPNFTLSKVEMANYRKALRNAHLNEKKDLLEIEALLDFNEEQLGVRADRLIREEIGISNKLLTDAAKPQLIRDKKGRIAQGASMYQQYLRSMYLYGWHRAASYPLMQLMGNAQIGMIARPGSLTEFLKPGNYWDVYNRNKEGENSARRSHVDGIRSDAGLGGSGVLNPHFKAAGTMRDGLGLNANPMFWDNKSSELQAVGSVLTSRAVKELADAIDVTFRESIWFDATKREFELARREVRNHAKNLAIRANRSNAGIIGLTDEQIDLALDTIFKNSPSGMVSGKDIKRALIDAAGPNPPNPTAIGNWADRVGRDWTAAVREIDRRGLKEVNRVAFSFENTKIDNVLGKVFMFHYWASRASKLYATEMMRKPWLGHVWYQYMNQTEAEFKAHPEKYGKYDAGMWQFWKSDLGLRVMMDPMSLMYVLINEPSFIFGIESSGDYSALGRAMESPTIGDTPLPNPLKAAFLNPFIEASLAAVGAFGHDWRTPDVTGTRGHERALLQMMQAASEFGFPVPGSRGPNGERIPVQMPTSSESIIRQAMLKVNSMAGDGKLVLPPAIDDRRERDFATTVFGLIYNDPKNKGMTKDELQNELELALADENGKYYREALTVTSNKDTIDFINRLFNPLRTQTVLPGKRELALLDVTTDAGTKPFPTGDVINTLEDAKQSTWDKAGIYDIINARNMAIPQLSEKLDIYYEMIPDSVSKVEANWNGIRYGDGLDEPITIGLLTYSPEEISAMSFGERALMADRYVKQELGKDGEAILQKYQDAQLEVLAGDAQLADYLGFRHLANTFDGSPEAFINRLAQNNPEWSKWIRTQQNQVGAYKSVESWEILNQRGGDMYGPEAASEDGITPNLTGLGMDDDSMTLGQWYMESMVDDEQELNDYKKGVIDDVEQAGQLRKALAELTGNDDIWNEIVEATNRGESYKIEDDALYEQVKKYRVTGANNQQHWLGLGAKDYIEWANKSLAANPKADLSLEEYFLISDAAYGAEQRTSPGKEGFDATFDAPNLVGMPSIPRSAAPSETAVPKATATPAPAAQGTPAKIGRSGAQIKVYSDANGTKPVAVVGWEMDVKVVSTTGDFTMIQFPDGSSGWVLTSELRR